MKIKNSRTKIVCTIGPASSSREILKKMIENGMDIARLNFSHGNYPEFKNLIGEIRSLSRKLKQPIGILQDLCGPKIRIGEIKNPEGITLVPGDRVTLTTTKQISGGNVIPVDFGALPRSVRAGNIILLDDGKVKLEVKRVSRSSIFCSVIIGGVVKSHKGVNLPDATIKLNLPTAKDCRDLVFGLGQGIDFVALSFVRTAEEIERVRRIIKKQKSQAKIVAKIEKHEAIKNLSKIIEASDGVMVARGDLGVELPTEDVPVLQKKIIKEAIIRGKPVITATQMMETMTTASTPTRAEVSDVANAVFDGTDAVMLSGETAVGKHPPLVVKVMSRVIEEAERNLYRGRCRFCESHSGKNLEISQIIGLVACRLAEELGARLIVAPTTTGMSAQAVASHRPSQKIVALTANEAVLRQLALMWGTLPYSIAPLHTTDELFFQAIDLVKNQNLVRPGDIIVITAGHPAGLSSGTNLVKVHRIE